MNKRKKPLSFSLCPLNIAYVLEQVAERQKENSRYSVSQYGDDLITHLRTKAAAKTELVVVEKKKPVKRFVPPTVAEVKEYCDLRGNKIDAETFIAHYKTNGWVQGKNKPVKCWKSCIITWEKSKDNKPKATTKNTVDLDDRSWADEFKIRVKK